jgi:hypothetical protein
MLRRRNLSSWLGVLRRRVLASGLGLLGRRGRRGVSTSVARLLRLGSRRSGRRILAAVAGLSGLLGSGRRVSTAVSGLGRLGGRRSGRRRVSSVARLLGLRSGRRIGSVAGLLGLGSRRRRVGTSVSGLGRLLRDRVGVSGDGGNGLLLSGDGVVLLFDGGSIGQADGRAEDDKTTHVGYV